MTQFHRRRYWLESAENVNSEKPHLGTTLSSDSLTFEAEAPLIRDHEVFGRRIVLGMTHLAMALKLAGNQRQVSQFRLLTPIEVELGGSTTADYPTDLHEMGRRFECRLQNSKALVATAQYNNTEPLLPADLNWTEPSLKSLDVAKFYQHLRGAGIYHGPSLKTVVALNRWTTGALAELEIHSDLIHDSFYGAPAHPAHLDGAIASCVAAMEIQGSFIPLSVKKVSWIQPLPAKCFSFAKINRKSTEYFEADIAFYNEQGRCLMNMEGVTCKALKSGQALGEPKVERVEPIAAKAPVISQQVKTPVVNAGSGSRSYLVSKLQPLLPDGTPTLEMSRNFLDLGISSNDLVIVASIPPSSSSAPTCKGWWSISTPIFWVKSLGQQLILLRSLFQLLLMKRARLWKIQGIPAIRLLSPPLQNWELKNFLNKHRAPPQSPKTLP